MQVLRDNWKAIRAEYDEVAKTRVHPWPETNLHRTYHDDKEASITEGEGWNVFGLYAFNKKRSDNCALCPKTAALIEAFPYQVRTAAFSILVPGAHILPHSGYIGYSDRVLRCHLGLHIPPHAAVDEKFAPTEWDEQTSKHDGCYLRAGNERWGWRDGELLVFDDTHVHEAWNFSGQERVILLLDFTRPPSVMPPQEVLVALEEQSRKDPFRVGNRGDIYLVCCCCCCCCALLNVPPRAHLPLFIDRIRSLVSTAGKRCCRRNELFLYYYYYFLLHVLLCCGQ